MTRVNLIEPSRLTNRHLVAEYKELSQLIGQVRGMLVAKNGKTLFNRIPPSYTLNTGHVTFFVDKLSYIIKRWSLVEEEMKERGMNAKATLNLEGLPERCFGDYIPTQEAIAIVTARISLRLNEKPHLYPDRELRGW